MKFALLFGFFHLLIAKGGTSPILMSLNSMNLFFQADPNVNCPSGYTQPANSNLTSCYKIYTYFTTSKNAANQCKKDNGTLASIRNEFVNTYLYYLATRADATSLWLGIECFNGDTSTCQNDDGTEFGYSNFKSASCQSNPMESCVSMSTIGRDSQEWSTLDCRQRLNFVCEVAVGSNEIPVISTTTTRRPLVTSTKILVKPLSCPQNYREFQGMCYNIVVLSGLTSGINGSAECRKIPGGNLAVIANSELNDFLATYANNTLVRDPCLLIGLRCTDVASTGNTSCKWDDGTPFVYNAFLPGYPIVNPDGCCDFNWGKWDYCHPCNTSQFGAYMCQAPKQPTK